MPAKVPTRRADLLKLDPSRTFTLRQAFQRDVGKRFDRLKAKLLRLINVEDAFGIKPKKPFTLNVFCPTGPGGGINPHCSPGGNRAFQFDASKGGSWIFGSGVVPFRQTEGASNTPLPLNEEYFKRRKPTHYNAKPDPVRMVSVAELTAWQSVVDPAKLRPIDDPNKLEPITVAKIGGRLTIQDGNHRAVSAFIQGVNEIPAIVTDFDKPGNQKYLKPATLNSITANTRWKFNTTQDQVDQFRQWLSNEIDNEILSDPETTEDDWWDEYVQEGYKKGAGRAFDDENKIAKALKGGAVSDFYLGTRAQFLQSTFANPQSIDKLKLLSGRVFTDLKGVTDAMATVITRTLTDGLAQGKNPREIGRLLAKAVDGIGKNRAQTIARTEIIRTHAEGQLDALEAMGVEEIGVAVEWATAGDTRVCPLCSALNGITLKVKEAHGLLPRHPNCRCAFIPANVGETKATDPQQKKSAAAIERAVDKSISLEGKEDEELEDKRADSKWAGADLKVEPVRPKSILDEEVPDPTDLASQLANNPELEKVRKAVLKKEDTLNNKLGKLVSEAMDLENEYGAYGSPEMRGLFPNEGIIDYEQRLARNEERRTTIYKKWEAAKKKIKAEKESRLSKIIDSLAVSKDKRMDVSLYVPSYAVPVYNELGEMVDTLRPNDAFKTKVEQAAKFLASIMAKTPTKSSLDVNVHQLQDNSRAFYSPTSKAAFCTEQNGVDVVVHEVGHAIELTTPGVLDKAEAFRKMRIARSKTATVSLQEKFPNSGYNKDEMGNEDDFVKTFGEHHGHYVGKDYKGNATEILSMGFQKLYEDPGGFANNDPEYFKFIIGIARGVL